jgi:hypothetical protein
MTQIFCPGDAHLGPIHIASHYLEVVKGRQSKTKGVSGSILQEISRIVEN